MASTEVAADLSSPTKDTESKIDELKRKSKPDSAESETQVSNGKHDEPVTKKARASDVHEDVPDESGDKDGEPLEPSNEEEDSSESEGKPDDAEVETTAENGVTNGTEKHPEASDEESTKEVDAVDEPEAPESEDGDPKE
ncbi:hypothetical protein CSKR_112271 [Clonorchis sinensis]|uniref:Uncharacterized protein n=1 Tax=Clonorchis sinensis TaxID=79923 RepID=A0A8T1M1H0_CLOSI|nr:hypothetical protein CSKR_112271 [Clonorchis sinensis]